MRRKSAISWNSSPDIGFDRAVNPYRGCEHGCIYCYARPTHAYLGYSPGLDFETKLTFKPEVAELLEKELRKPGYTARTLALGSNTDPYQPVERTLKLTRSVLQVLDRYNHPVGIVTKSAGVLRDLRHPELDGEAQAGAGLRVGHHAGCGACRADGAACGNSGAAASGHRRTDPGRGAGRRDGGADDPWPERRRDGEDRRGRARAGARHAGYVLLRLPHELRQMFEDWLATHFPDRAKHVLSLIRETRSGALSDARFHHRFAGPGRVRRSAAASVRQGNAAMGPGRGARGAGLRALRRAGGWQGQDHRSRRCRCSDARSVKRFRATVVAECHYAPVSETRPPNG